MKEEDSNHAERGIERTAQATLRVRPDRILTSVPHKAARQTDAENKVRDDEDR